MEQQVKDILLECETPLDIFNALPFIIGQEIDLEELENED